MVPLLSIVVPVYNGEKFIAACLESLLNQTVSKDLYEVLLVDNGSTDRGMEIARKYDIKPIQEMKKGSYSARNAGIKASQGRILGFIDADCIASSDWLRKGLDFFNETNGANILSGKVEFFSNGPLSIWGYFDRETFLNQEFSQKLNMAKTANLFVSADTFDQYGLFDSTLISGGDVCWTDSAVSKGASLYYNPNAVVFHPVRNKFSEITQKCFRVGIGKGQILRKWRRKPQRSSFQADNLAQPFRLLCKSFSKPETDSNFPGPFRSAVATVVMCSILLIGMTRGFLITGKDAK